MITTRERSFSRIEVHHAELSADQKTRIRARAWTSVLEDGSYLGMLLMTFRAVNAYDYRPNSELASVCPELAGQVFDSLDEALAAIKTSLAGE